MRLAQISPSACRPRMNLMQLLKETSRSPFLIQMILLRVPSLFLEPQRLGKPHGINNLADADGLGTITYQWYRDGQPILYGGTLKDGVNGVDGLGGLRRAWCFRLTETTRRGFYGDDALVGTRETRVFSVPNG